MPRAGTVLACGHREREVAAGRCWPCHLAHLRASGQGLKANRLDRLRQLQEEGRLTWARLWTSLAASYEEG